MKIKIEKVRRWEPKGLLNGPPNQSKIDEKTHLVTASAAKAHFGAPGSIWGYPPWRKRVQKHTKNVFRSIKIRKQISEKKDSEKYLPLQSLLERGGLGEAHLDIISYRIVSYRIVSYCIVVYCIMLYYIVLYCIILFSFMLFYLILYYIIL